MFLIVRNLIRKVREHIQRWRSSRDALRRVWMTRKDVIAHRMPEPTSKHIFLGLSGPEVSQAEAEIQMTSGFECWNLKKFTLDAFISALQAKIPPINENVLNNYRAADDDPNPDHGLKPREYEQCSWGLLLPEPVPGSLGGYGETLFLLNLYSPHFLHPVFYATDFGIWRPRQP